MTDTDERMIREIARLCSLPEARVERTVTLLQGGATIPFITRYRKEATGGLDEVQVGAVRDQLERLNALETRKRTVRSATSPRTKRSASRSGWLPSCRISSAANGSNPFSRAAAARVRRLGL